MLSMFHDTLRIFSSDQRRIVTLPTVSVADAVSILH